MYTLWSHLFPVAVSMVTVVAGAVLVIEHTVYTRQVVIETVCQVKHKKYI